MYCWKQGYNRNASKRIDNNKLSTEEQVKKLKMILREEDCPVFDNRELEFWLLEYGDFNTTAYELLFIKSQNTQINITGLTVQDTSAYFMRQAIQYRPNNSGVV